MANNQNVECPRKAEATVQAQLAHQTHWRADGTCSYCGSLHPDAVFNAIMTDCEIFPTNKNYKIYLKVPDPLAGIPRIFSSANFEQEGEGWVKVTPENISELPDDAHEHFGQWVQYAPRPQLKQVKFYFQHFSDNQREKFVEFMNGARKTYTGKRINLAYPGYFSPLPYFVR